MSTFFFRDVIQPMVVVQYHRPFYSLPARWTLPNGCNISSQNRLKFNNCTKWFVESWELLYVYPSDVMTLGPRFGRPVLEKISNSSHSAGFFSTWLDLVSQVLYRVRVSELQCQCLRSNRSQAVLGCLEINPLFKSRQALVSW